MQKKSFSVLAVLLVVSFIFAACSTAQTTTPAAATEAPAVAATEAPAPTEAPKATEAAKESTGIALPEVNPAELTGDVYTAGSSTVGPLTEKILEMFNQEGFAGEVKNDIIGSGAGFKRFCGTGETDVANASRGIKDSEKEDCGKLSPARNPIEFRVGTDAIAIVVSKENTFAKDITLEELGKIFTTAEKWSDVRADWPAENILRFTPGTDSGTFDFFTEVVIQKPAKIEKIEDAKKLVLAASNLQLSEDDNVLVQGVEGSKYAIGYFGFAYYQEQKDKLNVLSVNGIAPSEMTAEDGSYILSRPLFIYSDAQVMKDKPQVAGFINYYLTHVNDVIAEVGYFPASTEKLDQAKQAWLEATK